jgi:hypothetical protein
MDLAAPAELAVLIRCFMHILVLYRSGGVSQRQGYGLYSQRHCSSDRMIHCLHGLSTARDKGYVRWLVI